MGSKYVDSTAVTQVIGCVYNTPQLLDYTDKYVITDEDFNDDFHRIVFGAIYKLHELGAEKVSLENILDFYLLVLNMKAFLMPIKVKNG